MADAEDTQYEEALRQAEDAEAEACEGLANGDVPASSPVDDFADVDIPASSPMDDFAGDVPVEDNGDEEVDEHLRGAIDGNLRLKRMLSEDSDLTPQPKRPKQWDPEQAKVIRLLARWGLVQDTDTRHVLEGLKPEEVEGLLKGSFVPNQFDQVKSCAEQTQIYTVVQREKSCGGNLAVDTVTAFKFRNKLTAAQDKTLRGLSHKDLRYVLANYDGTEPLETIVARASNEEPLEDVAVGALPHHPGVSTMSRYTRLELIDPLADSIVFGDANLTFSLKLAKHRKALGHVGRVVATTFEEIGTLRERYPEVYDTIAALKEHCAEVWHGVDCTRIAVDPKFKGVEGSFGAVYYNFPHAGAVSGFFDGHPHVNWRHENLMRLFFRALRFFVKPGGIVKVASNASAVGVRYSYIIGGARENEFVHIETHPVSEWCLHRYGRSYGDRRDAYKRPGEGQRYNAQKADKDMVYCFEYQPGDTGLPPQEIRRPPSLKTLMSCRDGPFFNLPPGKGRERKAQELYQRFLKECSGEHVG